MSLLQHAAGPAGVPLADVADPWARAPEPPAGTFQPACVPADVPDQALTVLALDLGSRTGWAVRDRAGRIEHGTEDFAPRAGWSPGQRGLRFRSWLAQLLEARQVHRIVYEDVRRHEGVSAAHVYGLLEGLVHMAADVRRIPVAAVGVGVVKKHWTGQGNATKADMLSQARVRGYRPVDDNAADALAILHLDDAQQRGTWVAPPARPKKRKRPAMVSRKPVHSPAGDLFGPGGAA